MFRNPFANLPDITKNLLIINVLFFLATVMMEPNGINLIRELGMYYPSSENFRGYQIVTHFFMHGSLGHIFFNMFGLVVFGSHLERFWGKKRYLTFYLVTALGAALLHFVIVGIELQQAVGEWFPNLFDYAQNVKIEGTTVYGSQTDIENYLAILNSYNTPVLGASGALYGLLAGFALLFPNTELMLLFPPIPIKAKWLAVGLAAIAVYSGYQSNEGDSVAHFAHLGGMIFGFILIKIWQRQKTNFY